MQTRLIIIGAGQYGQNIKDLVDSMGLYKEVVFADDNSTLAKYTIENAILSDSESDYIVAIGNPKLREKIISKLEDCGKPIASIIHEKAYVAKTAVIGNGSIIEAGAIVNANTIIGKATFICAGSKINHNVTIGDYVQVDIGAIVPANKQIANYTKVQAGEIYV